MGRGLMAKVLTFGEEQQQKIPSISTDTRQKRNDTCLDYSSTTESAWLRIQVGAKNRYILIPTKVLFTHRYTR